MYRPMQGRKLPAVCSTGTGSLSNQIQYGRIFAQPAKMASDRSQAPCVVLFCFLLFCHLSSACIGYFAL